MIPLDDDLRERMRRHLAEHSVRTIAPDDRKRAEGMTSRSAIRALKRRISDAVYRHLIADAARQS